LKTPCDYINSLKNNIEFQNKMNELKDSTNLNYEKGFIITSINGVDSYSAI
jgi:hypothetical protein